MNDLRPFPDGASEDESASKLIFPDPGEGTDGLDVVEREFSAAVSCSALWS